MQLLIAGLAYDINADAVKLCTSYSNIKIPFFPFSTSSEKVEMKGYLSNQCTFTKFPWKKIPTKAYNLANPTRSTNGCLRRQKPLRMEEKRESGAKSCCSVGFRGSSRDWCATPFGTPFLAGLLS